MESILHPHRQKPPVRIRLIAPDYYINISYFDYQAKFVHHVQTRLIFSKFVDGVSDSARMNLSQLSSADELLSSTDELLSSTDELLSSTDELLSSTDEQLSSTDVLLSSTDERSLGRRALPFSPQSAHFGVQVWSTQITIN